MTKPNNPPAFPITVHMPYKKGGWKSDLPGLSLRDYFAAHCQIPEEMNNQMSLEKEAQYRYEYADAMLLERERGGKG